MILMTTVVLWGIFRSIFSLEVFGLRQPNHKRIDSSQEADAQKEDNSKDKRSRNKHERKTGKVRKRKKTGIKITDVSRNWTRKSDVLANVNRELIPANTAEPFMIGAERKVLDLQRWYCISRPQYKASCGISSVVSCWNYLYSTLGHGSQRPITQEEALTILGFTPDYIEKKFGPFTGNATVMRWFHHLNEFYGVKGKAHICYKPKGRNKTAGITSDQALAIIQKGLRRADTTFVYHGLNHFFCLIGYEETPLAPIKAYSIESPSSYERESWVLIGDPSKNMPGIQCIRWTEMVADLTTGNPEYYDIRRLWKGKRVRERMAEGDLHCIITLRKLTD